MHNTELILKVLNTNEYILYKELQITTPHTNTTLTVPEGFKTDLASTPRTLWSITPPFGTYSTASVIHDYCYRTPEVQLSRADVDRDFYELMLQYNTPKLLAGMMYKAVRYFGAKHYKARA